MWAEEITPESFRFSLPVLPDLFLIVRTNKQQNEQNLCSADVKNQNNQQTCQSYPNN